MSGSLYIVDKNDHDDATLSTSQAPPTGYAAELTQNAIRDDEWHSASAASQTITGTWTGSRTVDHFSIHGHGLLGASVRFQCGSYDSGVIAVADFTDPAIVVGDYTGSEGESDPYAAEMSFFLWFAAASASSYTISFSGTPSAQAYYRASRIWVGKRREFIRNAAFGFQKGRTTQTKKGRTFGASQRVNRGESWRTMLFDLNGIDPSESGSVDDLQRRCDTGGDMVISIYPGAGNRDERDLTYAGTLSSLNPLVLNYRVRSNRVQFEEN